ncbi:hypothetical protein SDC9_121436 [bioreactor metagenome]|uniref:Uncharacterized protein n=1 Tax=bioreactor metagenome TaxID=1076179 RepID=A0A645CC35_9ZZZZ
MLRLRRVPAEHLLAHGFHVQRVDAPRVQLFGNRYARVLERGYIERLADAQRRQDARRHKFVRRQVGNDAPVRHHDDAIHAAVEHVLKAVLDDNDGLMIIFGDAVDQVDGGFAGRGVEVCQRLVKEQDVHVVHHHARKRNALLLPAGKFKRRSGEQVIHLHKRRGLPDDLLHLVLLHALVFERKGDILAHRKAYKLPVGVLQNGADMLAQRKDALLLRFLAGNAEAALDRARVRKRNQPVDAAPQRALSAAGRAHDEHFFPFVDRQVDLVQRRLRLRKILKRKIMKFDDRLSVTLHGRAPFARIFAW